MAKINPNHTAPIMIIILLVILAGMITHVTHNCLWGIKNQDTNTSSQFTEEEQKKTIEAMENIDYPPAPDLEAMIKRAEETIDQPIAPELETNL